MRVKQLLVVAAPCLVLLLNACGSTDAPPAAVSVDATDPTGRPNALWQLVWSDEFNAADIDVAKWSFEEHCWGGGNNEQQCYTKRKANAFIENGALHIAAKRGNYSGASLPGGDKRVKKTLPFTSAKLHTKGKVDWKYGRFEVRAKMPQGQGTWSTIWMLPSNSVYGKWPASGEIDIVEAVNLKTKTDLQDAPSTQRESRVYGGLHYGRAFPENVRSGQAYSLPYGKNPADNFHTYAIEWEEGEIRWYVDNLHYATQRQDEWYSQFKENGVLINGKGAAPFDENFHLLLNLAVGGSWAENTNDTGVDSSVFPQNLSIDYVRVYQCSVDRSTGRGCATISNDAALVEGYLAPELSVADRSFATGPVFGLFEDSLDGRLTANSYDPENNIIYQELDELGRGKVVKISKSGKAGNVYFTAPPTNMSHWLKGGELIFDLNIQSMDKSAALLVKMDSGWPDASDFKVNLPKKGEWAQIRVNVADLVANGNSLVSGKFVDMTQVTNLFVIEPTGKMTFKLDNIRFEYPEADMPINFDKVEANYQLVDFGGNQTEIIDDPKGQKGRVAATVKSENAAIWAGTTVGGVDGFASPLVMKGDKPTLSLWVYSSEAGVPVRLKIADSKEGQHFAEVEVKTRSANQWERLNFDFSTANPSLNSRWNYNKVTVFFNFGVRGEDVGPKVFYWDELKVAP
ncbi:family 16 glycosylhydrolase [Agarivorans sp. MS3-6]